MSILSNPEGWWKNIPPWIKWPSTLLCTTAAVLTISGRAGEKPAPSLAFPPNTYVFQQLFGPFFPEMTTNDGVENPRVRFGSEGESLADVPVVENPGEVVETSSGSPPDVDHTVETSVPEGETKVSGDERKKGRDADEPDDPGHEFRTLLSGTVDRNWDPDPAWGQVLDTRRIEVNFVPDRRYDAAVVVNRLKSLGAQVEYRQVEPAEAAEHQRCINYMYANGGLLVARVVHAAVADREDLRLREMEFTAKTIIWLK